MRTPLQDEALKFHVVAAPKACPQLTRDDIGHLIANGSQIIIFNGFALKVNAWIPFHPGGEKAILHMVGRDATDEINAYVPLHVRFKANVNFLNTDCILHLLHFLWLGIASARSPPHG